MANGLGKLIHRSDFPDPALVRQLSGYALDSVGLSGEGASDMLPHAPVSIPPVFLVSVAAISWDLFQDTFEAALRV
jgi:hypothetical protein